MSSSSAQTPPEISRASEQQSGTVENPLVSEGGTADAPAPGAPVPVDSKVSARRVQLELALKGLKDGTLSEQEAAEVMDRLVVSQVEELRAELTSAFTGTRLLHDVIKSTVAHLTETPTNCTQLPTLVAS